jgi:4-amino-4-deoxy-L-arabinose transferase-like glycosyltransferase
MIKDFKTLPFWLFTFSAIIILTLSQLLRDGIFMDGMVYISVSKNLADGTGTFWDPSFSPTNMPSYHEQPPLYFGLLALFYKAFGTGMYVERLFCFLCFAAVTCYIHLLWRKIYSSDKQSAVNSWLPVLFWSVIPVCFWAYANHVEETVMAVFAVASVYHLYSALFRNEKVILNLLLAGLFIFLATLTKGIQGAFPLAAPFIYWLVTRNISFKKMMAYSVVLLAVPACIYTILLRTDPAVYTSFDKYFRGRLLETFSNVRPTTDSRFELLYKLFLELLPVLLLSAVILLFTKLSRKSIALTGPYKQAVIWFLLIGLSGTLPLMVTLEQRRFYLVTAIPFYVLALSMLTAPGISHWISRTGTSSRSFKWICASQVVVLLLSVVFTFAELKEPKRDKEILPDIYRIGKLVPAGEIISIPVDMYNDWNVKAYLMRNFRISLDERNEQKYFLVRKEFSGKVPPGYRPYSVGTGVLDLYVSTKDVIPALN